VTESGTGRLAAIDIGTNTVLLTVAELGVGGQIRPILDLSRIARLGEGVDGTCALGPAAIERTLGVLAEYAEACRAQHVKRLGVTGTSALRDARGAGEFLRQAAELLGVEVEVASGRREAELSYRGALLDLGPGVLPVRMDGELTSKCFVFDVGGGSTELILGAGDDVVLEALSLDLGSVRLFERHNLANLGSNEEFERLMDEVRAPIFGVPERFFTEAEGVVGVAGTVASLFLLAHRAGAAQPNAAHGGRLTLGHVNDVCSQLISMSLEERQRFPCLGTGRADVIVYGAAIVKAVLEARARATGEDDPSLIVSERGVRYGLLRELTRAH
jgi:exopolyphosphatase / guanosine-5'-triphosphate,3'-diphosphate pyrophosphatase